MKNKVLLFGSWEELKIHQSQYAYSIGVPTAAEKQGDFSSASDAAIIQFKLVGEPGCSDTRNLQLNKCILGPDFQLFTR